MLEDRDPFLDTVQRVVLVVCFVLALLAVMW